MLCLSFLSLCGSSAGENANVAAGYDVATGCMYGMFKAMVGDPGKLVLSGHILKILPSIRLDCGFSTGGRKAAA